MRPGPQRSAALFFAGTAVLCAVLTIVFAVQGQWVWLVLCAPAAGKSAQLCWKGVKLSRGSAPPP